MISCEYDPKRLEPISKEASIYMARLPTYEELPPSVFILPPWYGAYRLPIKTALAQWNYLHSLFEQYYRDGQEMPPEFFQSLPGVSEVRLSDSIYCRYYFDSDIGVYHPLERRLNGKSVYSVSKYMSFEPTIAGAISAFFLAFWFDEEMNEPLICPREKREKLSQFNDYGNNLSDDFGGPICIPWGFRVETLSDFHFVVSCLNVSLGIGVYDLHVEVRDGKIVQAKNPDIRSPKYDVDKGCHRVSVFLQRDPHKIIF